MLRPVAFQSLDETLPLLTRGFPGTPRSSWVAGIDRLKRYGAGDPSARAAYLLEAGGQDVGVILAIPSTRQRTGGKESSIVNLSSWYIDPEHRWRGPRMLQKVVASDSTIYTDLTPTAQVRTMIGHFGFQSWTEGTLLFVLPWMAIGRTGDSQVVPLHKLAPDSLDPSVQRMLEDHAAAGCTAVALWDGNALHPLIFSRTTRRGLGVGRLIYADDRGIVTSHMAAIARFLLRQKIVLLAVNADRQDHSGGIFTQRLPQAFFKGRSAPPPCDLAYSEYAFLHI